MQYSLILPEVVVKSPIYSTTKPLKSFLYLLMGALQRTGHVVQKHLAGGQTLKTKDISFLNDVVSLFKIPSDSVWFAIQQGVVVLCDCLVQKAY